MSCVRSNRALDAEAVGRLVQQLWSAVGLDGELLFPGDRRKENMKPKDAIELLKGMQNPLQDYAEMVGAPTWSYGCRYVYPDPEDYAIEEAINTLEKIPQVISDLKYYLDTNEENGVVYIPKFVVEKILTLLN